MTSIFVIPWIISLFSKAVKMTSIIVENCFVKLLFTCRFSSCSFSDTFTEVNCFWSKWNKRLHQFLIVSGEVREKEHFATKKIEDLILKSKTFETQTFFFGVVDY